MIKIIELNSDDGISYLKQLRSNEKNDNEKVVNIVENILYDIRNNKDQALIKYTNKFDSEAVNTSNLKVSKEEIKQAYTMVEDDFVEAIKYAKENIYQFHQKQVQKSWMMTKENSVILGQQIRALDKVGIYVPGGTAAYPSSVLMNAIPAIVAGVKSIIMTTPPLKDGTINPHILVAADIAGVSQIYKIGGAQAIGALAYGTNIVPKVDKIVGPGNIFVALAKRAVFGYVDIDMIAGPSEILIISDENGDPKFLAADLMSQAEHDVLATSTLVTTSLDLAKKVNSELKRQVKYLERKDIILESIKNFGTIIVVNNLKEGIEIANEIAPEHLELMVENPFDYLNEIKNAGSIFLGKYSPEPLGDYIAGPNHVLPTSGTARFFSPLSVDDYIKKSSYIYYGENALKAEAGKIVTIANTEGLTAHANSILVRFENDK
jgi:histidinol dehydrogenase